MIRTKCYIMSTYKTVSHRHLPKVGVCYNRLLIPFLTSIEARRWIVSSSSSSQESGWGKRSTKDDDLYDHSKVSAMVGHNFPDFIEKWNRHVFRKVGYAFIGLTGASIVWPISLAIPPLTQFGAYMPSIVLSAFTAAYWKIGLSDMAQTQHTIRRNYPVLGNIRYIFETVRPEIRQVR